MDKGISVLIFLTFACVLVLVNSKQCVKHNNCICVFDDGSGMIDLTSMGHTDGTPLFIDQPSSADVYWYSYNPCGSFNDVTCINVAACQYDPINYVFYDIGVPDKVSFSYDGQSVVAKYPSRDGGRNTFVTLVCDQTAAVPSLDVAGETTTTQYYMTLKAAQACVVTSPYDVSGGGLSAGSVLLIIFFVPLCVYFATGITFNKVRHDAKGSELIPNLAFWTKLPALIRDGCAYSMAIVCRKRTVYVSM